MEKSFYDHDVVVAGSGAGGAVAAWALQAAGLSVVLIEEGEFFKTKDFAEPVYSSMKNLFRDWGTQAAHTGESLFPVMQGRAVGGTTVISGAVMHPLPKTVYEQWCAKRPDLARLLPFAEIENASQDLARELGIQANLEFIENRLPSVHTLRQMGLRVQAMARSAPGCVGSGRCLQGCPSGAKNSLENTLIPAFLKSGGKLLSGHKVRRLEIKNNRVESLTLVTAKNKHSELPVRGPVIVSCGVVQTPLLMLRSGLRRALPALGTGFQCHMSSGVIGVMANKAFTLDGPPQGLEAFGKNPKIKLATQLIPPELLLSRIPVVGAELQALLAKLPNISSWTCSIQAEAVGTVSAKVFSGAQHAKISFRPSPHDLENLRDGIMTLAEFLFKNGAERVFHGIHGVADPLMSLGEVEGLKGARLSAKNFVFGAGHLFGGMPMGEVVDYNLAVRGVHDLYVMDASVFPGNIGVNPQLSIMSIALASARKLAKNL